MEVGNGMGMKHGNGNDTNSCMGKDNSALTVIFFTNRGRDDLVHMVMNRTRKSAKLT